MGHPVLNANPSCNREFVKRLTIEATPKPTLRAKGTLISEPRFSTARCNFPTRERENGLFKEKPSTRAVFPFSRGKNHISQGVENRGSLIGVPLALRAVTINTVIRMSRLGPFFCPRDYEALSEQFLSQEPATLVLKRRMGVRGSIQGPPLGGQIPEN